MNETVVDVRGLKCPMPLLRLRGAVAQAGAGDEITVLVTDPSFEIDYHAFVGAVGHEDLGVTQDGDEFTYRLKVGGGSEAVDAPWLNKQAVANG